MTQQEPGSVTRRGSLEYRADVDGLRAAAVLLVVVFHFNLIAGAEAGFIGVDIFFVISGFLITSLLRRQLDEGTFSIKAFYLNRVRRLAPALFVVLMLVMAAGSLLLFPADLLELSKQALLSQLYVANFYYREHITYFGLHAPSVLSLHTWSLAVKEQFYLLYPVALLLMHRYLRRYFWATLFVGLAVSFGLNIFWVQSKPEFAFYLLPTRARELLSGGLIPFLNARLPRSKAADEALSLLGLGLILASVAFKEGFRPHPTGSCGQANR